MTFLLVDKDDDFTPSAIITTETTSAEDLQELIWNMANTIPLYDCNDLEEWLPDDCKITWINKDVEIVW